MATEERQQAERCLALPSLTAGMSLAATLNAEHSLHSDELPEAEPITSAPVVIVLYLKS